MSKTIIKTVTKKYNAEGKMIEKIVKTETVEDDAAVDNIGQVGITWQGDGTGGIGYIPCTVSSKTYGSTELGRSDLKWT